jgi:DNA-binding CsgD family transcriptional regulator
MDPVRNPFSPGAGNRPPELAGRDDILRQALLALDRIKAGRSERSPLMIGLRGVGKTVLLVEIRKKAEAAGYKTVMVEAQENMPLPRLLLPALRKVLLSLDGGKAMGDKAKRGLRVLKSFLSRIKLSVGEVEISLDSLPEVGVADSGQLDSDLADVFVAIGEAAAEAGNAVAVVIDELQYLSETELSALIMAMHKISQERLPVILVGAGLPQLAGNTGRAKSYAERLFVFPPVGALRREDSDIALQEPVRTEGVAFTEAALAEIYRQTKGYPYFLQEWGSQSWNSAQQSPIDADVVKRASTVAIANLDQSFFRVRFDRLTPREKEYLRALAELGNNPQRSGEIAQMLGVKSERVAPLRSGLIGKGMIYSPQHGDTAFTVPLFDEFMKRIMPEPPSGNATPGKRSCPSRKK